MSKKAININIKELEGGHRNQALYFADCIRGSGSLIGVFGDHMLRAPKSYDESLKGNCMVEEITIPVDEIKVNPWNAMACDIKTNLTPIPAYEMDNWAMTDLLEQLFNDAECKLDLGTLRKGVTVVEIEED